MKSAKPSVFVSRRQFIVVGFLGIAAAWAGTLLQSILFPKAAPPSSKPVEIALNDLPVGAAQTITFAGAPARLTRNEDGILALSLICTHLGCTVQWEQATQQYHCPCHDGRFDEFGDVISGPPPLPLERLPVRLTGDQVVVGETF